jgi:hypothetical protein
MLFVRPDLTLQLAVGESAHDVELTPDMAYGLATALLAVIADLQPWANRPDAELIQRSHDLAFLGCRVASETLKGTPAFSDPASPVPAVALDALRRAFVTVALLDPTGEKHESSDTH